MERISLSSVRNLCNFYADPDDRRVLSVHANLNSGDPARIEAGLVMIPHRLHYYIFLALMDSLPDAMYFEWLGEILAIQAVGDLGGDLVRKLLDAREKGREALMTPEERETFANLPATGVVYRGCRASTQLGWHWTLDMEQARAFAGWRSGGVRIVSTAYRKERVIRYSARERELLIDPLTISKITIVEKWRNGRQAASEMSQMRGISDTSRMFRLCPEAFAARERLLRKTV